MCSIVCMHTEVLCGYGCSVVFDLLFTVVGKIVGEKEDGQYHQDVIYIGRNMHSCTHSCVYSALYVSLYCCVFSYLLVCVQVLGVTYNSHSVLSSRNN